MTPLTVVAWNVCTLMNSAGSDRLQRRTAHFGRELGRYKIEITALSETRHAELRETKTLVLGTHYCGVDARVRRSVKQE